MSQMTLDVPDVLVGLPTREQALFIRAGLYEAGQAWRRRLEAEIAEAKAELTRFETRYGASFARFQATILPGLDTLQAHQDYNDWFFWESVLAEKQSWLAKMQRISVG